MLLLAILSPVNFRRKTFSHCMLQNSRIVSVETMRDPKSDFLTIVQNVRLYTGNSQFLVQMHITWPFVTNNNLRAQSYNCQFLHTFLREGLQFRGWSGIIGKKTPSQPASIFPPSLEPWTPKYDLLVIQISQGSQKPQILPQHHQWCCMTDQPSNSFHWMI